MTDAFTPSFTFIKRLFVYRVSLFFNLFTIIKGFSKFSDIVKTLLLLSKLFAIENSFES